MSISHKTTIMIHCLDTRREWGEGKSAKQMMAEVTKWHTDPKPKGRGWRAVAYAFIGDYEGNEAKGRDLDGDGDVYEETGAGARGWNKNTIHLAIAGGRGSHEKDQFSDHYTPEQDAWLRGKIAEINKLAGRELDVKGHNEVAAKACPGFDVQEWLKQPPLMPVSAPKTQPKPNPISALIKALLSIFGGKS